MLIRVFCVAEQASSRGVLEGGATGLLNKGGGASKQQAVEFPQVLTISNITLSRRTTTVRSNDTLVDTPFQLISGFFHVNQGILCSEHAEQASSRGVLERGGGATTGSGLKPIRLQV